MQPTEAEVLEGYRAREKGHRAQRCRLTQCSSTWSAAASAAVACAWRNAHVALQGEGSSEGTRGAAQVWNDMPASNMLLASAALKQNLAPAALLNYVPIRNLPITASATTAATTTAAAAQDPMTPGGLTGHMAAHDLAADAQHSSSTRSVHL